MSLKLHHLNASRSQRIVWLLAELGVTIVLVTHDVDEALQLADRIVLLGTQEAHPGGSIRRILEVGKPRPRDRADPGIAILRAELLDLLGVETHHPENYITKAIKAQRAQRGD